MLKRGVDITKIQMDDVKVKIYQCHRINLRHPAVVEPLQSDRCCLFASVRLKSQWMYVVVLNVVHNMMDDMDSSAVRY